jgi:hypothetical protein
VQNICVTYPRNTALTNMNDTMTSHDRLKPFGGKRQRVPYRISEHTLVLIKDTIGAILFAAGCVTLFFLTR